EGTRCSYAVNTPTPVIYCESNYYACEKGIWFVGTRPSGTWRVCDAVPATIYTIPPSCPVHYATYCHVYRSTTETVTCGYTPGYMGTCVQDGTVVFGTGYRHEPWIQKDRWIGRPATFGFSVGIRSTSSGGLNVGLAVGSRPP